MQAITNNEEALYYAIIEAVDKVVAEQPFGNVTKREILMTLCYVSAVLAQYMIEFTK